MKSELSKTVLTIAGSDPSGGAGIQADIKTFTILGVYCGAIITSITCQNTRGVNYFSPLPPSLVQDQVESVLSDLNVSHIKIGMLGSNEIVEGLKQILTGYEGEIVFDPVMAAGSGDSLYKGKENEDIDHIKEVIRLATVITPNLDELKAISGMPCSDSKSSFLAAGAILTEFPRLRAVCLTGGHMDEDPELVTDYLVRRTSRESEPEIISSSHPHIESPNLHGTGCTFSSAFTAYHLLSGDDRDAFSSASNFTARLIKKSATSHIGQGNGPLLHFPAE